MEQLSGSHFRGRPGLVFGRVEQQGGNWSGGLPAGIKNRDKYFPRILHYIPGGDHGNLSLRPDEYSKGILE
ncbi:unnamed protein product [Lasius platythorax]|uniref:Uncharacterized protein n=1 Tax=Lasius platythorax TaxID=488582 RepID=A0AAV2NN54_9HYME